MRSRGSKPRYLKVKEGILKEIKNGNRQVGDKLPGERKLAMYYDVSQMTANRAIQELVREGYLEREMGVGTFVLSKDPDKKVSTKVNIVIFGELGKDEDNLDEALNAVEYLAKDVYMGTILRNLMEAGVPYNCEFSILTAASPFELEKYIEKADRKRERFVLVNPLYSWNDSINKIGKSGLPIVAISANWENMGVAFVDADNYQGAKTAISHLYSLGHRKIAVFYSWAETSNSMQRIKGAKDAMYEFGLESFDDLFININAIGNETLSLIQKALEELLEKQQITAVFATGFELASAASSALKKLNLSIPNDVSLVGFDDSPAAIYLQPPLTTVKQPFFEIAKEAIDMLMSYESKRSKIIPTELIVRNSTAARP